MLSGSCMPIVSQRALNALICAEHDLEQHATILTSNTALLSDALRMCTKISVLS